MSNLIASIDWPELRRFIFLVLYDILVFAMRATIVVTAVATMVVFCILVFIFTQRLPRFIWRWI